MSSASDPNPRAARYREKMRQAGMRPVQIWVPDTRMPAFACECRRQSTIAAQLDREDTALNEFMDAVLEDLDE